MNWFSTFLLIIFVAFGSVKVLGQEYTPKEIDILPTTRLSIDGEANVKNFTCRFNSQYFVRKKNIAYATSGKTIRFKNAVLNLKNEGFNCGHKAIDKDFHLLLKTKQYPQIGLELIQFTQTGDDKGEVEVQIEIAGKKKTYTFPVSLRYSPIDRFVGTLRLNIRDFDLEPPKKLMGLIVIKEEIEITFDLLARI